MNNDTRLPDSAPPKNQSMTKDQASDLTAIHGNVVRAAVDLKVAEIILQQAQHKLNLFMFDLQQKDQK
jgi:hypothetical protein